MVGYTRLMQQDETQAKLLRDRQRNVVDKSIGDVVHDEEGVFGDAVNVAARVQSLSVPGGVMISGKVFEEIKNHPGIKVEAFGEHDLKNVFNPISIFALANEGLSIPEQSYVREITGSHKNSVAVLPFANLSPNPENEYFSDGVTEEIINALVKVDGLQVPSRTSVFAYKNTKKDIREIGKELNVATILEGSVRQAGNKIRVTAQLINTTDGFHVWSESYDGETKDIFKVQDEIAKMIAEKLESNFEMESESKLYEASTDSVVAYNHYLQGLFYWNKRTPESVQKAIKCYEKAIRKCITYTKAYSGLANCYSFLGSIGYLKGKEAFTRAEKYALKALELNDFRGGSYVALGFVDLLYNWNFERAEANFRKAITMEPNNEEARLALSMYYRVIGDLERMLHHTKVAVQVAPVSLPALLQLGQAYLLMERYDKALETFEKILELDPLFRAALEGLALTYAAQEKYGKAMKAVKKYMKQVDSDYKGGTQLGYIAALQGDRKTAEENIKVIAEREKSNPDLNLSLDYAVIFAALGDNDEAFKYLNKAVDEKLGSILLVKTMNPIIRLQNDPRYLQLLERIGLKA